MVNLDASRHNASATRFYASKALVSVIIPAYNAAQYIERALDSVIYQTYRHLEIWVVDDGSTDDTAAIAKHYATLDSRITLIKQSNAGVAVARNVGIEQSTGEFIAPLDADDIWHPEYIEHLVRALHNTDESVGMAYAWSADIDEQDYLTGGYRIAGYHGNVYPAMLHYSIMGNSSAAIIKRHCFKNTGGYSSEARASGCQGCEDYDMHLRITEQYQVKVVPQILVGYRQSTNSLSCNVTAMSQCRSLSLQILQRSFPAIYSLVKRWSISTYQLQNARQCCRLGNYSQARRLIFQALKNDAPMVLLTYRNWPWALKAISRSSRQLQNASLQNASRQTANIQTSSISSPKAQLQAAAFKPSNARFYPLAKTYARSIVRALSPASLYRYCRIQWLASKIRPSQQRPKVLPIWQTNLARLQIRKLALKPNRHLFLRKGYSPLAHTSTEKAVSKITV
ncbi:MAG: glycosyltransferase family A protein [Phormidesmis sp.]